MSHEGSCCRGVVVIITFYHSRNVHNVFLEIARRHCRCCSWKQQRGKRKQVHMPKMTLKLLDYHHMYAQC